MCLVHNYTFYGSIWNCNHCFLNTYSHVKCFDACNVHWMQNRTKNAERIRHTDHIAIKCGACAHNLLYFIRIMCLCIKYKISISSKWIKYKWMWQWKIFSSSFILRKTKSMLFFFLMFYCVCVLCIGSVKCNSNLHKPFVDWLIYCTVDRNETMWRCENKLRSCTVIGFTFVSIAVRTFNHKANTWNSGI